MKKNISGSFLLIPSVLLYFILVSCSGGGSGSGLMGDGSGQPQPIPQDTINAFLEAAEKNDSGVITASFTSPAQEKYKDHLSDMEKIKEFSESLSIAKEVDITENLAIYKSTYIVNGEAITYFIFLVKDVSGNWKFDIF